MFKTIIPLTTQATIQATTQATAQTDMNAEDKRTELILDFCKEPKSRKEIQEFLELKNRKYLTNNILRPLVKGNLLNLTMPDKPTSPNQKYCSNR